MTTVLRSHRRQVTVLFCDLRGYTNFADAVEPEELMGVLGEFHAAIGRLVERYEATVGSLQGDGVELFFNDPIEIPDARSAPCSSRAPAGGDVRACSSAGASVATSSTSASGSRSDTRPAARSVSRAARTTLRSGRSRTWPRVFGRGDRRADPDRAARCSPRSRSTSRSSLSGSSPSRASPARCRRSTSCQCVVSSDTCGVTSSA